MARATTLVLLPAAIGAALWMLGPLPGVTPVHAGSSQVARQLFDTAQVCIACHSGLVTRSGEDVSFGPHWRASMMANSARDPYWQAGVRRETLDHPQVGALIEDECSACHMPMARYQSKAAGHGGGVFANLPVGASRAPSARLAADGVSCTACHQITPQKLGDRASFTGGFHVDTEAPFGRRQVFGPFQIDKGRAQRMQSSSGFVPTQGSHLGTSEMCATCHTLITQAFGPTGDVVGELAEQVPYLEWQHSQYGESVSCQSCHMPEVSEATRISSESGQPRGNVSRHQFRGGNAFMMRVLNRHARSLGVEAFPQELDVAAERTTSHLASDAARISVTRAEVSGGRLLAEVTIESLAGHKLPTGYPSRRAWLHVTVRDRANALVFESGRVDPTGRIDGNDNDDDGARVEPHHAEITSQDQVQIYESIMLDAEGRPTTGLLRGVRYAKDNRVLPKGFDKATAPGDIAVHGDAVSDADFTAGGDRVRYSVAVPGGKGPFSVEAELLYQPVSYRWAESLGTYDAMETTRFVQVYRSMASASVSTLARVATLTRQP